MALYPGTAALKPRVHPGNQDNLSRTHSGCLYWYRSRHYDAARGRFGQADKWGKSVMNPVGYHAYGYVQGNPMRFVDPMGYVVVNSNMSYSEIENSILNSEDDWLIYGGHTLGYQGSIFNPVNLFISAYIPQKQFEKLLEQRKKSGKPNFNQVILLGCQSEYITQIFTKIEKKAKVAAIPKNKLVGLTAAILLADWLPAMLEKTTLSGAISGSNIKTYTKLFEDNKSAEKGTLLIKDINTYLYGKNNLQTITLENCE
jgi:RHS repeat-associated protein